MSVLILDKRYALNKVDLVFNGGYDDSTGNLESEIGARDGFYLDVWKEQMA